MDLIEAMEKRHSVRSYEDRPLDARTAEGLAACIGRCNAESGLNMQLVLNEPRAFGGFMAHYGKFSGVKNYVAVVAKKGAAEEEKCGYYGEEVVLEAQRLGLNTCWVALTYRKEKSAFRTGHGEKLRLVIALGYGTTHGSPHTSKRPEDVIAVPSDRRPPFLPQWFLNGVNAALLAPTAMNQQKFTFALDEAAPTVRARAGAGFYTRIDLGIAKRHFELGAGKDAFSWADERNPG